MRVAKASSGGHLFPDAVQWVMPILGPKETKEVSMSLIAPSAGLREIMVSARADKGLEQRHKLPTSFEGIPALNWQTEGTAMAAPGQEITYTITVKNPGSAPAKNVKIVADLPEQVEFRQAQPAFQRGERAIFFNAIEIPAKESVTLKVVVVAKKAGEARFQFQMTSEGTSSGPLKNTKATSISPGGEPKKVDLNRIGALPPLDIKSPDAKEIVPAQNLNSGSTNRAAAGERLTHCGERNGQAGRPVPTKGTLGEIFPQAKPFLSIRRRTSPVFRHGPSPTA